MNEKQKAALERYAKEEAKRLNPEWAESSFDLYGMRCALEAIQSEREKAQVVVDELIHMERLVSAALEQGIRIPGLATTNGAKAALASYSLPSEPEQR